MDFDGNLNILTNVITIQTMFSRVTITVGAHSAYLLKFKLESKSKQVLELNEKPQETDRIEMGDGPKIKSESVGKSISSIS